MNGFLLTKIATQLVYPLSISIALSVVGLVLLARGRSRRAGVVLGVSLAILWVAATPVVGFALQESLEARYAPVPPEQAQSASAIVLLGDAVKPGAPPRNWADLNESADRIVHASRLYRARKAPLVVVTGGGDAHSAAVQKPADTTADLLVEWGVPRDAILLERESRTTYENAVYTRKLLDARGIDGPVLLVTSAAHMRRSMAVFESAGLRAIPAATDYDADGLDLGDPRVWIPDVDALQDTNRAIKEYLGMLVYRLRGQIRGGAR
jgi:uncharacterized SAM-binding protein YcdF (DUF218 family)